MPSTLLVFNLNSTLADAAPRYSKAFCRVCREFDLPVPDPARIEAALGELNLGQIMAKFSPGLPEDAQGDFMEACNRTRDALLEEPGYVEPVYPHLIDTLEKLAARDVRFGLCTNIGCSAMDAQIGHYGLDRFFPPDMRRGKTGESAQATHQVKASAMHYLAERHASRGGSVSPMISVGDSVADYAASAVNGFSFMGFAPVPETETKLRKAGIAPVFRSYSELPNLVLPLLGAGLGLGTSGPPAAGPRPSP